MLGAFVLFCKIVLCVILISGYSAAIEKHWLPDLEWQTASNWADGLVPEIDSHIIFPQLTRHAVGIASDLRLSEIDLPVQGSLVLPRNGKLQVRLLYCSIIGKYVEIGLYARDGERDEVREKR